MASMWVVLLSAVLTSQPVDGIRIISKAAHQHGAHLAQRSSNFPLQKNPNDCSIAVLVAVSTRNLTGRFRGDKDSIWSTDFLDPQGFMQSFANQTYNKKKETHLDRKTGGKEYGEDPCDYNLYLAYDNDDKFYSIPENRQLMEAGISRVLKVHGNDKQPGLTWVESLPFQDGETGPVKAWNKAAVQAHQDANDYFFFLGEDVQLNTKRWGPKMVSVLKAQTNLGAVGPKETNFLLKTERSPFLMVHKTHFKIFNHLLPTELHNWYVDDWMMQTYQPFDLYKHITDVFIYNRHQDTRYAPTVKDEPAFIALLPESKKRVSQYLKHHNVFNKMTMQN